MSTSGAEDSLLLVHAYCDGELDPVNARAVEQQIARDPRLAAERDRILALRRTLHDKLSSYVTPTGLGAKVEAAIGAKPRGFRPGWNALAATIAAAIVIAVTATWYMTGRDSNDLFYRELTSSHARALIAARITDVASSDQHTIKPWFSTRTAQAPQFVDLAPEGFNLVGGRLDVINKLPVPTLVYGHREHFISLTEMPASVTAGTPSSPQSINGFHVIGWSDGDTSYWATSDIAMSDLRAFVQKFRAAASRPTPP